jgi:osmotically inducible protein OsmC
MSTTRSASARYEGLGKEGRGSITTQSGALTNQFYGFATRFENEKGTNPEELIAAAHSSCFTMALAFGLSRAGFSEGTLETSALVTLDKDDVGFVITRSDLTLRAEVPGITGDQFAELAAGAKATCPVSRLLNADVTLTWHLA